MISRSPACRLAEAERGQSAYAEAELRGAEQVVRAFGREYVTGRREPALVITGPVLKGLCLGGLSQLTNDVAVRVQDAYGSHIYRGKAQVIVLIGAPKGIRTSELCLRRANSSSTAVHSCTCKSSFSIEIASYLTKSV